MRVFVLGGNTGRSYCRYLINGVNKSCRFNFGGVNFSIYKLNSKKRFSSEIKDSELEKLGDNFEPKKITLKLYEKNEISKKTAENLPIHTERIDDNAEVEIFTPNKNLSKEKNFEQFKQFLDKKEKYEKEYRNHKMKVSFSLFFLLLGLFSLWIPLYKVICERQGYSVKTSHTDYKFDGRKLNVMKKFTVKFIDEVDVELPWKFEALQKNLVINAGETCLAFYRARNLSDEPIIGLSVYDVHPQSVAMYFNKIQCFCFENQMLGPKEEVDLPVFFYIDPAINDNPELEEYTEFVLKYTFYMAKKQDLAVVMAEHLKKEKEDREKLNNIKRELNKQGKNYKIEELDGRFTGLPGVNPELQEFFIQRAEELEREEAAAKESKI